MDTSPGIIPYVLCNRCWQTRRLRLDIEWTAARWRLDACTRTVLMLLALAVLLTFVSMIEMNNVITRQFKVFEMSIPVKL